MPNELKSFSEIFNERIFVFPTISEVMHGEQTNSLIFGRT